MRVFSKVALVGAVMIAGVAASMGSAQDQSDSTLPEGPEAALVGRTCTACHVAAQFTTQHRTKEQWADTVNMMIGYGAQVPDDQVDPIVNYLAKNFGPAK